MERCVINSISNAKYTNIQYIITHSTSVSSAMQCSLVSDVKSNMRSIHYEYIAKGKTIRKEGNLMCTS